MTDDERKLLSDCALAIGGISQGLADGVGLANWLQTNRTVIETVGEQWLKAFGSSLGKGDGR